MRPFLIAAVLAACVLDGLPAHAQDDPLAHSRDGAVECFSPDLAARTCRAMSTYRFLEDGQIANDAIVHIQNSPLIVMSGTSMVYVRDGMVCDRVEQADFDSARFTIDGAPAPADVTQALRKAVFEALIGIDELCSLYTPEGDGVRVTFFADGVERPEFADRMIWIHREDGYRIGAADASPI